MSKVFRGEAREAVRALDGLSLAVEDGEWLVVTGPSGCGKTTLLRLIAGLEHPDSGEILMGGRPVTRMAPEERNVAMVFQEPALYPHMTVFQNISFGLKLRRLSPAEILERVSKAAETLELGECLERRPMELSGGQRQRVAVARALVRRPQVFLFDEPLGSLDVPAREYLRRRLSSVCRAAGSTVIYVTHDPAEAMLLGDRIAVVKDGRLEQVGSPSEVYGHPATVFVAQFVGAMPMNLWQGTLTRDGTGAAFETGSWSLKLSRPLTEALLMFAGRQLVLGIRPEEITLAEGSQEQSLAAVVDLVEDLGADRRALLRAGCQSLVARLPASAGLNAGDSIRVRLNPAAVRFFDPANGAAIV